MDILQLNLNKTTPDAPTENELRFHVALLATVPMLVAAFIGRFVFDWPLIPELMAQFIFAVAPIWMVELAVGLLGPFAKHLAFLAATVIYSIALLSAVLGYFKLAPRRESALLSCVSAIGFAFFVWAVTGVALLPAVGSGIFGSYLPQGPLVTSVSLLVVHLIYGAALALATVKYIIKPQSDLDPATVISRRRAVRLVGFGVLAVGIFDIAKSLHQTWWRSGSGRVSNGSGVFPEINNLALEVTPTADFYQVSKNAFDPQVDVLRWNLEVGGLVENPFSLTYDEMKAMPSVERYATLACISNEVGGDLIGTALWRGVRLKDLLDKAVLKPDVVDIVLRAGDDYTDSIPLDRAIADGTLLVFEMNGEPLTPEHGFPVRLLVPGIYGMKNVKWLQRIEAVDSDIKGYWQRRGWDDRAEYKTMSRVDAPDSIVKGESIIAGIAFAGDRGVSKVEISTDGGASWEQAEIKPPLSPISWVLWHKAWRAEHPGEYRILVRATDGRGDTQTSQKAPPAPSGSSGYHGVTVSAESS